MSGVRLRLLGAPAVEQAGKPLALPTRKLLGLLAYLALEGPTPRSKLAGLFWSEQDETAARGHLRRELNRLRHTPLAQALHTERDTLGLEPLETDVAAFRAAVEHEDFPAALELYRGPLLEGLELAGAVGFEAWLEQKREELSQTYRSALQQQAERLEATHDLRGALAARLTLLREDELQERHHREAMRLHALLGEREAALERFERLRALLRRELHLDPLPETLELAQQIAQGALRPPLPPSPTPTPTGLALNPPLIGREAEWARLEAAWEARQGLYLAGPPGVGKSRLLLEFARHQGSFVFLQAQPSDSGIPYAFYSRAIRQSLAQFPGLELAPWVRRELSRLVPELSDESPPPITTPEGKLRLLEALTEAIRALGRQGVRSIVTDDLHFVRDAASLEVAAYAMTRLLPEGVLRPLVAFRQEELDPATLRTIREQVEAGQAVLVELKPFSETDLLRLVRALSGASGAIRFTQRLYQATGGNPLFVLETLKALYESGALQVGPEGWHTPYDQETTDYRELPLPASVREAVWRRIEGLGAAPRRLLEAASLAGDGFSLEVLRGATALSEWESLEALEQALAADLLHRQDTGYAFSHELVRRSVREGLSPERRQLLHRKLAQSLARQGGNPARVAEHWEEGGRPQEAIPWRLRAAEAAVRVYAHREALEQYQMALADGAEGRVAYEIQRERARLWQTLDERTPWAEALGAMERLAQALGEAALQAETRLGWAEHHLLCGRYREALAEAEGVLQSNVDTPVAIKAHHLAGLALMSLGRLAEAEPRLRLALQAPLPSSSDAPALVQQGRLHMALCTCALQRGDLDLAHQHTRAALDFYLQSGYRSGQLEARSRQGLLVGLQGDTMGAIQTLEHARTEAQAMNERVLERSILLNLFKFLFESGQLAAALPHLERGLALAREPQDPRLEGIFLNNLGVVYRAKGELGKALECFEGALEIAERFGMTQLRIRRQIALAENYLDLGSPAALPLIEQARSEIDSAGLGELELWLEAQFARYELMQNHPEKALARLTPLLEVTAADHNDHDRILWLMGRSWLMLGQPRKALEAIAHQAALPAFQVRLLAVQLQARLALGEPVKQDIQTAVQLLRTPGVAMLESLELHLAVVRAYQQLRQEEKARQARQLLQTRVKQMAESLEGYPELKEGFERGYRVHLRWPHGQG
ncbi:ATP-binding protein [Calidithermus timidus]|jgi:DNA-binding SARP family transcriptional activator|uniref:ATP-binding protein n=1 Tax=Calidithermus timidus TaxID=307124 RepID=UPI000361916F|nr:AAA family ATPase [Calidithermus timidus]